MQRIVVEQVRTTHVLAEAAITNRIEAIRLARELGVSWTVIGAAMGMSRQSAHKHFSGAVAERLAEYAASGIADLLR